MLQAEIARDKLKERLDELRAQTNITVENLNKTLNSSAVDNNSALTEQIGLMKDLEKKIISLQNEQTDNEKALMNHEISRHNNGSSNSTMENSEISDHVEDAENSENNEDEQGSSFYFIFINLNVIFE